MKTFDIIDLEQGSDKWKEYRLMKIGASEAATIMGENPFETPLQLWERKMLNKSIEDNDAMRRGRELEPIARSYINSHLSAFYEPLCIQSKTHEFAFASLDGYDESSVYKIVEIKCPTKETIHLMAIAGEIPSYYLPQIQHQLMVSGFDEALYCSFDGKEGAFVEVKRDDVYCEKLLEKEKEFYKRMLNFDPPPPTDRDFLVLEDSNAIIMARAYQSLSEKLDALEAEKAILRKKLLEFGSHPRIKIGDLKMCKSYVKGRIEYDKIEALKGMDLEPYRKPTTEVWRITA